MNRNLKVLLADDDPIVRHALREVLGAQPGIEIVATVTDGASALDAMTRHIVDVALLDVDMPGIDGVHAAGQIASRYPQTTVVMLTAFEHEEFLARALRAGAHGFLTKDIPIVELADLIRKAHGGEIVMGPRPTRIMTTAYVSEQQRREEHAEFIRAVKKLPAHLRAVFDRLAQAVPNRTIARDLHLAESTVRVYVSEILSATGCTSRTEVALLAMKAGIIT